MNKKHIAFNTHLIRSFVLFIVFLGLSISCAIEKDTDLSIIFAVFILLPVFVFSISPLYFAFSDECIEIVYNFGQREKIRWNDIRSISLRGSWIGAGGLPRYVIVYPRKEKGLFFVVGEIQKTRKTKKLIEKYYKKKIM